MNSMPPTKTMPLLVTAAVIIQDARVLITRRPAHKPQGGFWEFPGGKIDPGESPVQALEREIQEELNLEIRADEIIEALYYQYDWGPVLILAYQCSIRNGKPQNIEVAEHQWVPLADLHQYDLLLADKPLIVKLQNQQR